MSDLHALLRRAKSVAIVGCSDDPYRASHHAALALAAGEYVVVPVNPKYEEVNGVKCYPDFDMVPDALEIDIVNVFRNAEYTLEVVQSIIRRAERTGRKPAIWTQPGVSSPEAELTAIRAGFDYVQNRCIMTELALMD